MTNIRKDAKKVRKSKSNFKKSDNVVVGVER